MNIDQAVDLVKKYAAQYGYALAIHKVAEYTPFSKQEINAELARRRKVRKQALDRTQRKNKVPDWVLNGKEWE